MIDLSRTLCCVLTHIEAANENIRKYLLGKGMPEQNVMLANTSESVVCARNQLLRAILPRVNDFDWFLFSDYDSKPSNIKTDPFLDDVAFDVVGAKYDTGNEDSWLTPDQFHMGFVRVRTDVLHRLSPPWFLFGYNEDGTKITQCECGYFRQKLLEAGCSITTRGIVGHQPGNKSWHTSA